MARVVIKSLTTSNIALPDPVNRSLSPGQEITIDSVDADPYKTSTDLNTLIQAGRITVSIQEDPNIDNSLESEPLATLAVGLVGGIPAGGGPAAGANILGVTGAYGTKSPAIGALVKLSTGRFTVAHTLTIPTDRQIFATNNRNSSPIIISVEWMDANSILIETRDETGAFADCSFMLAIWDIADMV